MSNVFSRLLEEGQKQQAQLQAVTPAKALPESPRQTSPTFKNDSLTERQHDSTLSEQHDSMTARQHDSLHEYLRPFLQARSINKTTLRYPQILMDEVDEVIYQVKKTYHQTLSKNELFVLALAALLHDFKHNATRSLIYKTLLEAPEK